MNYSIELNRVSKSFAIRSQRPESIKKVLVNLLKGQINLGKTHRFQALKNISFSVKSGEFLGIMGRNGAGKSTLLKIISGIYKPTQGSIHIRGQIAPLIELGAGFHPDLSGKDNIFLNAAILGFGKAAAEAALPKILDFAEIGQFINTPVRNYSSGMIVRLGFSIAVHLDAPILLLDEVLAVGDLGFQKKCLEKIQELHRQGRTILFITHDPNAIENFCSRCILIENHEMVFDGDPKEGSRLYKKLTIG